MSLFGGFGQQNQGQQQNKPTFSFGTPAAGNTNNAQSSSTPAPSFSFGNSTAPAANAGQSSTGLFGAPAGQQPQQQQQQQAAPSLFGGFSSTNNTNNNATQLGTPNNASQPFSFGAKPAGQTTPAAGSGAGLFGNLGGSTTNNLNNQQQQQQNKPLFNFGGSTSGTSQTAPAPTLSFGTASTSQPLGASQQQNQQQNAASTSTAPITKSTRFEDLPEPARKMIEEMETYIQGRVAIYESLKAEKLGKEIEETSHTLRQLSNEFSALSNHLAHDSRYTADLRNRFEQSLRDAVKAVQIVDAFRAPVVTQPGAPPSQPSRPHPTFLQEFFRRKAEELTRRLTTYKTSIEQIQGQLSRSDPDQVKAILPTLRAQHAATLQLASRLSTLEHGTTELKDEYRDLWREKTGSVRDPFIERRREVLGSENGVLDAVGAMSIR